VVLLVIWVTGSVSKVLASDVASSELIEVVATGVGEDLDAALYNAYSNAVQQALGMYVDAETLVRNDEIVRDQVLIYSKGFVARAEVISQRDIGHVVEVRVLCGVRKQALLEKARASRITLGPVDGSDLHAQVTSQLHQQQAAAPLLHEALRPFATLTLQRAEVIGDPVLAEGAKAILKYRLRFSIDIDEYQKAVRNLTDVLEQVAVRKEELPIKINRIKRAERFTRTQWSSQETLRTPVHKIPAVQPGETAMLVMTWWNPGLTMSKWVAYYLPYTLLEYKNLHDVAKAKAIIELNLLGDSEQDLVGLAAVKVGGKPVISPIMRYRRKKHIAPQYVVAPFFYASNGRWSDYVQAIFTALETEVGREDLARVKRLKLVIKPPLGREEDFFLQQ